VADDFCKSAASGLDEATCALVNEVLDGASHADLVVADLAAATAADDTLTSRLALWGRRMVGEALGVVQSLIQAQPGLGRLLAGAAVQDGSSDADADDPQADAVARLFGRLTAEHTHRMARLGLTA